jgi:hypothetical protein
MPRCRVCGFGQNHLINLALRRGQTVAEVRRHWPHLSTTALTRHQRWCLGLHTEGEPDAERVQHLSAARYRPD